MINNIPGILKEISALTKMLKDVRWEYKNMNQRYKKNERAGFMLNIALIKNQQEKLIKQLTKYAKKI